MHHKILNFRNIGNIETDEGIITGDFFYRGGPLHELSEATIETLQSELKIKTVIDFRDFHEINQKPNHQAGFNIHHLNIMSDQQMGSANPNELFANNRPDDSKSMMVSLYRHIINSPNSQREYTKFFEIILEADEPIYFHCSAGKDRTGLAAAFLLKALGASDEAILEDYLLTNELSQANINQKIEQLEATTSEEKAFVYAFFGVYQEYIEAALDEILKNYESVEQYFQKAFNLTPEKIQRLRAKYIRK